MFRFSIREILLLTVVVALAFGWWLHARRNASELATLQAKVIQAQYIAEMESVARLNESQMLQSRIEALKTQERLILPAINGPLKLIPELPESKLER
jgi:hypothetical protein